MVLDNQYQLGDLVYLKTDPDNHKRMVSAIKVGLDGGIIYTLSMGTQETLHYELEISGEPCFENV